MFNLMIAKNDYALAFAGIGHRYPTIETFSKSIDARQSFPNNKSEPIISRAGFSFETT